MTDTAMATATLTSASGQWREVPFSEAVQINPTVRLERGAVYPFVDMASVNADSRSVESTEEREFKGSGSKFQSGDTLMARITPCLENGKIARYQAIGDKQGAHGSTEFIVVRGRPGVTDNVFAYYLTQWNEVREYAISQMTGTSGRQRVPVGSLDHLNVRIPSLPEQRAIANILGTLDDKIELNRQMNQTLEEMARAIFKDWFIDFGPTRAKMEGRESYLPAEVWDLFPDSLVDSELGPIPEGWEVKALDGIANFRNGLALQRFRPQEGEEALPVVKIAQLRSDLPDSGEWASENITPACIIDDGDIVFSWSGSLMVKVWCGGLAALNQHLFKVTSSEYPKWFFLHSLEAHLTTFQGIAADKATTMGHIKRQHLSDAQCVVPGERLLAAVGDVLESLLSKRVSVEHEVRTLGYLRDVLLPQFLAGRLRLVDN